MEDNLETFYVYRSLHSDESWGATLATSGIKSLPNIDFGMTIYAKNEKEAIYRARTLYERIHQEDSEKSDIKDFTKEAMNALVNAYGQAQGVKGIEEKIAKSSLILAVEVSNLLKKHFRNTGEDNE